jgi:hypothetical protein
MLAITPGATVNVRLCPAHIPNTATVTAVDPIRQTVTLSFTSGALLSQPTSTVSMSAVRLVSDPYQFSVPVGGANGIWTL